MFFFIAPRLYPISLITEYVFPGGFTSVFDGDGQKTPTLTHAPLTGRLTAKWRSTGRTRMVEKALPSLILIAWTLNCLLPPHFTLCSQQRPAPPEPLESSVLLPFPSLQSPTGANSAQDPCQSLPTLGLHASPQARLEQIWEVRRLPLRLQLPCHQLEQTAATTATTTTVSQDLHRDFHGHQ